MGRGALAGVGLFLLTAGALWTALPGNPDRELARPLPERRAGEGFATSDACRSCHPGAYAAWKRTYHRTMTQVATPEAVLAPFDGRVLRERGRAFAVLRREHRFYLGELEPEAATSRRLDEDAFARLTRPRRVVMVTGSHRMQAYWVEGADGLLEQVPFVYLVEEGRWLANSDSFLQPPDAPDAPLWRYTWSDTCVSCHATGGPWDASAASADRTPEAAVGELGIACEACHGPGEEHVARHRSPTERLLARAVGVSDPTIVNPRRLPGERSASVCGRCHVIHPAGEGERLDAFVPGDRLDAYLDLAGLLAAVDAARELGDLRSVDEEVRDDVGGFWRDGTVRIAGREYLGLMRSPCAADGGLACTSCHRMHGGDPEKQLEPSRSSDETCAACHGAIARAPEAHSGHRAVRCIDCHMPYTSFGLLSAARSHRVGSPTASGAAARARPNACSLCHLDRPLGWVADVLSERHGTPPPELPERHRELPAGVAWMLGGDAVQRALVAWHAGWAPARAAYRDGSLVPALRTLLEDRYPAVRQLAWRALAALGHEPPFGLDEVTQDPVVLPDAHRGLTGEALTLALLGPGAPEAWIPE
ncbi:MAG: ammonia-forming cytochrome c nitrite reductase subunit c552 [Sandaracinaceae bacterium]